MIDVKNKVIFSLSHYEVCDNKIREIPSTLRTDTPKVNEASNKKSSEKVQCNALILNTKL
jgi:hypothetical protein